jgi:hypothetical protein
MASSLPHTKFDIEEQSRSSLFYSRYQYVFSFTLRYVSALRRDRRGQQVTDQMIKHRADQRHHWNVMIRRQGGSWMDKDVDAVAVRRLIEFNRLLEPMLADSTIYISGNRAYLYTNSLAHIDCLKTLSYLDNCAVKQAVVTTPPKTLIRNSDFTKRTYFRFMRCSDQTRTALKNLIVSQQDAISPSPSFRIWLNWDQNYSHVYGPLREYFFIDHNDDGLVLMLNLVCQGITRTSLTIQKPDK